MGWLPITEDKSHIYVIVAGSPHRWLFFLKKESIWERISPMIKARISTFPESSPDNRPFCLISKPLNLWYGLSLLLSKHHALGFSMKCSELHNHAIISTSAAWNIRIMSATSTLLKMKFTKADQAQKLDDSWKKKKKSESDAQRLSLSRLRGTNRFNLFPKWALFNPKQTLCEIMGSYWHFLGVIVSDSVNDEENNY